MSRSLLLIVATVVTIGGLMIVVWAARLVPRFAPIRTRLVAVIFLLIYAAVIILRPSPWPIIDLGILIGAVGVAVLIGGTLNSFGAVVVLLLTAAAVDFFSVSGGLTRTIIEGYQEGTSDLLLYLALVAPIGGHLTPIVGISDLLLGGSVATALIRLGLKPIEVMAALTIGLLGALVYGIWLGLAPALPFIAAAVIFLVWWKSVGSRRNVDGAFAP